MEQHENKLISNDLQKTCRTCLTIKLNENDMKLIYDYCNVFSPAVNDVLLQKLNISKNDGFPQQICIECIDNLTKAYSFWCKCIESQQLLERKYGKIFAAQISIEEKLTDEERINKTLRVKSIIELNSTSVSLRNTTASTIAVSDTNIITLNKIENDNNVQHPIVQINVSNIIDNDDDDDDDGDSDDDNNNNNNNNNEDVNSDYDINNDINYDNTAVSNNSINNNNDDCGAVNGNDVENIILCKCKVCNKLFKTQILLIQHIASKHVKSDQKDSSFIVNSTQQVKLLCKYCGNSFISVRLLEKHENAKICLKRKTFTAPAQPLPSSLPSNRKKGDKIIVSKVLPPSKIPNASKCEICDKVYNCIDNLRKHMIIHSGKKFKCDECGKEYSTQIYLTKHIKGQHLIHNKVCAFCGLVFTNLYKYEYHKLMHEKSQKFKCKYCEKTFCQVNKRTVHERVHTKERPYLCSVCGKDYPTNYGLKVHMYGHTGDNPNACSICNRQFLSKPQLSAHMQKHNDIMDE